MHINLPYSDMKLMIGDDLRLKHYQTLGKIIPINEHWKTFFPIQMEANGVAWDA
jgi:hypothetical protein